VGRFLVGPDRHRSYRCTVKKRKEKEDTVWIRPFFFCYLSLALPLSPHLVFSFFFPFDCSSPPSLSIAIKSLALLSPFAPQLYFYLEVSLFVLAVVLLGLKNRVQVSFALKGGVGFFNFFLSWLGRGWSVPLWGVGVGIYTYNIHIEAYVYSYACIQL
jgi:hypothetical protein